MASPNRESLPLCPYQTATSRAISERFSNNDFVGKPNVLTWLLGRMPTTFEQFTQRSTGRPERVATAGPDP